MAATRIGAGLSTDSDTGRAADEAAAAAAVLLAGRDPDLAVVFASHAHLGALDRALGFERSSVVFAPGVGWVARPARPRRHRTPISTSRRFARAPS